MDVVAEEVAPGLVFAAPARARRGSQERHGRVLTVGGSPRSRRFDAHQDRAMSVIMAASLLRDVALIENARERPCSTAIADYDPLARFRRRGRIEIQLRGAEPALRSFRQRTGEAVAPVAEHRTAPDFRVG